MLRAPVSMPLPGDSTQGSALMLSAVPLSSGSKAEGKLCGSDFPTVTTECV